MKWFKRILIGLALIVGALVVISLFLPSTAQVSRSISIAATPEQVFPYVNDLKRFNQWSPWAARDPEMVQTYTGAEEGVGQTLSWESDDPNVGNGSQTITESVLNSHVAAELDFGDMGIAQSAWDLEPVSAGTEVTWSFESELGANPVMRYMGLMFDKLIGTEYETGLASLKELVESNAGASE